MNVEPSKAEVKVNDSVVKGVRFGSHPGKTRIVLDLNQSDAPLHTIRQDPAGDALAVRFWFPQTQHNSSDSFLANIDEALKNADIAKNQGPQTTTETKTATLRKSPKQSARKSIPETAKRKKTPAVVVAKKPSPETSYLRARLDTPLPAYGAAATRVPGGVVIRLRTSIEPKSVGEEESERSLLHSITYAKANDGSLNSIRIEVSNLQNYLLERLGNEEYALRLFGTAEPRDAKLRALCAPEEARNLQVIVPKAHSGGTVLDIYVEEGTHLRAVRTAYGLELQAQRR